MRGKIAKLCSIVLNWKKRSRCFSWSKLTKWANRSWIFLLSVLSLIAIALPHLVLVIGRCDWLSEQCCYVLGQDAPQWYRAALLHGPWMVSLPLIVLIDHFREKREAWRMRYAICWMVLFGITFGYMAAYHWGGLQGSQSHGETLGAIGLATVGPASLLFVIWRGRLQGQANQIARKSAWAERYQQASVMLASNDVVVRLAGIDLIGELDRADDRHRRMSKALLRAFLRNPRFGRGEDTHAAVAMIASLEQMLGFVQSSGIG